MDDENFDFKELENFSDININDRNIGLVDEKIHEEKDGIKFDVVESFFLDTNKPYRESFTIPIKHIIRIEGNDRKKQI